MGNFEEEMNERKKLKETIFASIYEYHIALVTKGLFKDQASVVEALKIAEEIAKRTTNEKNN